MLFYATVKHMPAAYPLQQPAIPRIHNVGDSLVTTNACLINGGACFSETVHTFESISISNGRMDITSGMFYIPILEFCEQNFMEADNPGEGLIKEAVNQT